MCERVCVCWSMTSPKMLEHKNGKRSHFKHGTKEKLKEKQQ